MNLYEMILSARTMQCWRTHVALTDKTKLRCVFCWSPDFRTKLQAGVIARGEGYASNGEITGHERCVRALLRIEAAWLNDELPEHTSDYLSQLVNQDPDKEPYQSNPYLSDYPGTA